MITEALRVLLFGMLGVFLVLGLIFGVIVLLSRLSSVANRREPAFTQPASPVLEESGPIASDLESEPLEVVELPPTISITEPLIGVGSNQDDFTSYYGDYPSFDGEYVSDAEYGSDAEYLYDDYVSDDDYGAYEVLEMASGAER